MILTKMSAAGTGGSRVTLWFDDGAKMTVSAGVVVREGLYSGMALEEEALARLMDSARQASARDRAVRIVSAAGVSEQELKRRLVRRGERPEDAGKAADWLREIGVLDDAAMAKRVAARCVEKGYGAARIRQELYQKGIPAEYWEEALEGVPDMSDAIDGFLRRRLRGQPPDQKELKRVTDALLRRGHSWNDIRSALNRYQDGLDLCEDDGSR